MPSISINETFKTLIPPLSDDEYQMLEESIKAEGCREPLVIWGETLIDGHNRYAICTKLDIPFKTTNIQLESEDDAIQWIIRNQLARRNISDYQRAELALKLREVVEKAAKARKQSNLDNHNKQKSIIPDGINVIPSGESGGRTREILAKDAGVSSATMARVMHIHDNAPEEIKQAARSGDMSINAAYKATRELKPKTREQLEHEEFCKEVDRQHDMACALDDAMTKPGSITPTEEHVRFWLNGLDFAPRDIDLQIHLIDRAIANLQKIKDLFIKAKSPTLLKGGKVNEVK